MPVGTKLSITGLGPKVSPTVATKNRKFGKRNFPNPKPPEAHAETDVTIKS
jgi:hypothetical protein